MIPRTLCALVALSLTLFANGQSLEIGDAVTPVEEAVVTVDEFGVEWVDVPYVEEEAAPLEKRHWGHGHVHGRTPLERRQGNGNGNAWGTKPCKKLEVRKEWRDLNPAQKTKYIEAVQCLMSSSSFDSSLPSKFTRFDDFVIAHAEVADYIHGVAQFLPWHRHFGYLYHQALKEVCNYKGPFTFWDWTRDTAGTAPIADSPLFNAANGFGGGGEPGTYTLPDFPPDNAMIPLFTPGFEGPNAGCVKNGPFHGSVVHYGPNRRASDHCIVRNFEEALRPVLSPANVNNILSQTTYDNFWNSLDGIPFKPDPHLHDAGHGFVGGDMASYYTSNNDPLFYLHHAGVDRVWWKWQSENLANRLYQIEGKTSPYPPYGSIDLTWTLPFTGFSASVSVNSTMDPRNEPYCYTY